MEDIQNKLIGALIGLARATDGNEHLISASSTALVIESLSASEPARIEALLGRVEDEKQKMVPDCFLCTSPCGRTSPYDLSTLKGAAPEVREIKTQILSEIRRLASGSADAKKESLFYRALIAVGMDDFTAEDLLPILQEIHNARTTG